MARKIPRSVAIVLAALAFTLCYAGIVGTLAVTWANNPVYSYGFVLPLISAYVLSLNWVKLRVLDWEPDYLLGLPITLAGISMLLIGRLSTVTSVQEASLVVTATGLTLLLFGRQVYACVWFPITYLLLGTSVWSPAIGALQPLSQALSARIAAVLLQTTGMPVLWSGTRVVLPNVTLEVMRECSGVNQVLAIVAMALPTAYLLLTGLVSRVLFVGFAVTVAYLSNGVRIALVGFLAYRGLGTGDLRGMHVAEGMAVSALGYLLLFASLPVLSRLSRAVDGRRRGSTPTSQIEAVDSRPLRQRRLWLDLATLLFVLSAGVFQLFARPAEVGLSDDLQTFPTRIGEWTLDAGPEATEARFPAIDDEFVKAYTSATGERHFTALDDELVRAYRNAAGERVRLYIGYQRSQREGQGLAGEASRALAAAASPVTLAIGPNTIVLNQIVQERPTKQRGMLYWYDLNGRVVGSMYRWKLYMMWDAITRRRTNGAIVMVAWEHPGGSNLDDSRKPAVAFVQAVMPILSHYIPS